MSCEIELKLALPPRELAHVVRLLAERPAGQSGRQASGRWVRVRSVYLDTPDLGLARAGIALRLRHEGGRTWLSVKADREAAGGLQQAREWEGRIARDASPDPALIGDPGLRARVEEALGGACPAPLFETDIRRMRVAVQAAHGLVEVSFDRGRIRAGGREAPVCEIEFELLAGAPESLFDLAEELLSHRAAAPEPLSKADRGLALLRGAAAPAEPDPAALASVGEAARAWLSARAEAIGRNLQRTLTEPDPEGPHQLRVALRRLRAALWLFRPALDPGFALQTAAAARDLGRLVAPLRDADVLVGEILIPRALAEDPDLAEALARWRARVRRATRQRLRSHGAAGMVIRLARSLALAGWARGGRRGPDRLGSPVADLVAPRLARLWSRISEAGDRLAALDAERRHELRKDIKKLRYAVEMSFASEESRAWLKALRRLQESLGALNDLAVLEGFRPALGDPGLEQRLARLVAGMPEAARARGDLALGRACRHWRALVALTPPWAADGCGRPRLPAARNR